MTQPIGEEFIRIRPDLAGFRAELEAQLAAVLPAVQQQITALTTAARTPPAAEAAARPQVPPGLVAANEQIAAAQLKIAEAARETQVALSSIAVPPSLGGIAVASRDAAASLTKVATAAKATSAALNAIVLPPGLRSVTVATEEAALSQSRLAGATAASQRSLTGLAAPAGMQGITTASEQAAAAQTQLAGATAASERGLAALVLPPGIRSISAASQEAATAQTTLAASAQQSRAALSEIVLPPGIRSVTTASEQAAGAQAQLAGAASATRAALNEIVLPTGVRSVAIASEQAAAAQVQLAGAAETTRGALAGLVLPPGIRSVAVASEQAAVAQTELAAATRASNVALRGLVLPPGVRGLATEAQRAAAAEAGLAASSRESRQALTGITVPPAFTNIAVASEAAAAAQVELAGAIETSKAALRGFVLPPGLSNLAAASTRAAAAQAKLAQATTASSQALGSVVLPAGVRGITTESDRAAASQAKLAGAAEAGRTALSQIILPPGLRSITTASEQAAVAQSELAASTEATKTALSGIILPPGIRSVATASEQAAAAQAALDQAAVASKAQLAGIVLPPGLRSITVASNQAALAQQNLATQAAKTQTVLANAHGFPTVPGSVGTGALRPRPTPVSQLQPTAPPAPVAPSVILPQPRQLAATAAAQRQVATATQQTTAAQKANTTATAAANNQTQNLTSHARAASTASKEFSHGLQIAERDAGRYARGMVAATAASTGFFRAVSFASGAFLVGAAIGAAVGTAINEFKNMVTVSAQTNALIKATGGAANVTAGQVNALSQSLLRLTGVDDEQTKAAANVLLTFRGIRNEGEGLAAVFDRSTKAVLDISTVMGTDLLGTAKQVGKALQDPVRGITALRRAGVTFSQSERDLVKRLVETGRTLEAQKFILAGIEGQIGGTAEAVGKTLPGRLRILREESKNSLGEYVKRISESQKATELFSGASQGIGQAFGAAKSAVAALGPSLLNIATGLAKVTQAIGGVGNILLVTAAYKGMTAAFRSAVAAEGLFAVASAGAARANLAQAVAAGTATAALEAQAVAEIQAARAAQASFTKLTAIAGIFAVGAAASHQYAIAVVATGVALAGLVAKAVAARAALIAAGQAATVSRIALAAFGGTAGLLGGLAVVAAGAAIGLIALGRAMGPAAGSTEAFNRSIDGLSESLRNFRNVQGNAAGAAEDVSIARQRQIAATDAVTQAERRLANSPAQAGSLQQLFLTSRLGRARQNLTEVTNALTAAEVQQRVQVENQRRAQVELQQEIETTTKKVRDQIEAVGQPQRIVRGPFNIPIGINFDTSKTSSRKALDQIQKQFDQFAQRRATTLPGPQIGLVQSGNIDLFDRKIAHLGKTIATVRSISIGTKLGETLIPTIIEGRAVSAAAAIEHFRKTGENLGTFQNVEDANRYAEALHRQQDEYFGNATAATALAQALAGTQQARDKFAQTALFDTLQKRFQALAASADPVRKKIGQVGDVLLEIQRIPPTAAQTDIIMRLVGKGASVKQILQVLGIGREGARRGPEQVRLEGVFNQNQLGTNQAVEDEFKAQRAILATLREKLTLANHNLNAQRRETDAAKDARDAAKEALGNAQQQVVSANRALADAHERLRDVVAELATAVKDAHDSIVTAITAARDATNEAISSAKSNLQSMGQSLADMLSTARDELNKTDELSGKLGERFRDLSRIVQAGGGGPATQRAAQQISFSISGKEQPFDAEKLQRQFGNLTDSFIRGLIKTPAQFNKRLQGIFTGAGVSLAELKKVDPALARKITDILAFIKKQAVALPAGTRRGGGADQPEVVNIAAVIKQGSKDIANARVEAAKQITAARRAVRDATRDIGDAEKNVADAIRGVRKAESDLADAITEFRKEQRIENRLHRRALRLNAKAVEANTRIQKVVAGVDDGPKKNKSKPTGNANTQSTQKTVKGTSP